MKSDFMTVYSHPSCKRKMLQEDLLAYDIVINVSDRIDFEFNNWLCKKQIKTYSLPLGRPMGALVGK